jgi:methylmalonyl-CoA mutase N-terminal domain/subunit
VERLRALRARRDKTKWEASLRAVDSAARSEQNLMPHIIHAVESYCTVGEISDTLRKVFGEYQETVVI